MRYRARRKLRRHRVTLVALGFLMGSMLSGCVVVHDESRSGETAAAASSADTMGGKWHGLATTTRGSCAAYDVSVSIENGKMSGTAKDNPSFNVSGTVTGDGALEGAVTQGAMFVARLRGSVVGDTASGTWNGTGDHAGCGGSFSLRQAQPS